MSQEIINQYYQAFNRQDFAGMLSFLDPDVVHEVNEGEAQVGIQVFKDFLASMDEHYSEQVENLVVFTGSATGRFAAEFNINGKYLKSQEGLPPAQGQPYYIRVGAFFEVANNKITRVTNWYNLHKWIQAVELKK